MAERKKSMRDILRAKTVGAKKQFKSEIIEWNGEKFEIREPSVRQRAKILQASGAQSLDPNDIDLAKFQTLAVIYCTYIPGTNERVFEEGDLEALMEMPSGTFVDDFAQIAFKYLNVQPEVAAKNFAETKSDS